MVKCQVLLDQQFDVGLAPAACLRTLEADEEADVVRFETPAPALSGTVTVNGMSCFLLYHALSDTLYAFAKEVKGSMTRALFESARNTYRLAASTQVQREKDGAKGLVIVRVSRKKIETRWCFIFMVCCYLLHRAV